MDKFTSELIGLKDKLHNYALSLTRNKDDAEDLLHDVLTKALTKKQSYAPINFKAWVFIIMINTFKDRYRREQSKRKAMPTSRGDEFELDYATPENIYITKEIIQSIDKIKNINQANCLKMKIQGYKYKEIGAKLDLPLGTIKTHVFYGRKRLTKIIEHGL